MARESFSQFGQKFNKRYFGYTITDLVIFTRILLGIKILEGRVPTNAVVFGVPLGEPGEDQVRWKFVDSQARVYKSFDVFLGDNKLPRCYFAWTQVSAEGALVTHCTYSPSSMLSTRALKGVDVLG